MKRTLLASFILLSSIASPTVIANAPCLPLYLSAGVGISIPSQTTGITYNSDYMWYEPTSLGASDFILPNVHWENKFKTGVDLNLALGYRFLSCFRGEAEFYYQNFNRKITGTYGWREIDPTTDTVHQEIKGNRSTPTSTRAQVYALMANLYYDVNMHCNWTPFIGAGLGIVRMHSDVTRADGRLIIETDALTPPLGHTSQVVPTLQTTPKLYGYALGLQLKLGVGYALCDNLMVNAQYRLLGTTHFQATDNNIVTNPEVFGAATQFNVRGGDLRGLLVNAFEINLQYSFGG